MEPTSRRGRGRPPAGAAKRSVRVRIQLTEAEAAELDRRLEEAGGTAPEGRSDYIARELGLRR